MMANPSRSDVLAVTAHARGQMRHTEFARRLGVHPRTIRRAYQRGALPGAKEHGERILVIPTALVRLAEAYGLRQVERMAQAGQLS